MIRPLIHLLLHILVPVAVAGIAYRRIFWRAFAIMMATMLVDADHLLADPVYDPGRCSIGYHPLHLYPMLAVYAVLAWLPATRLVGIGLLIHMFLDGADCVWMSLE